MKTFNKQIKVTVELDTIANQLLNTISPENKHRDNIVEAIIGRMDANNDSAGMTLLYNALCGFSNDVNFEVGDIVSCTESCYGYWDGKNESYREIAECKVININIYSKDKLHVEYNIPNKNGNIQTKKMWVSHLNCSKIAVDPLKNLKERMAMHESIEHTIDTEVEGS